MAGDGDVLAHLTGVVEPGADKLIAEESGLVLIDQRPCWFGVATAVDEGGQGSDGAEDESEVLHLVGEYESERS